MGFSARRGRLMRSAAGLFLLLGVPAVSGLPLMLPPAAIGAEAVLLDPAAGMTLKDAVDLAIRNNPGLAGQRAVLAQAEARRDHAAQRPGYAIGGELENVLPLKSLGPDGGLEATLRLSTVIELGDKRARRVGAAERDMSAAAVRRDMETLDLLTVVTRRFIGNLTAQAKLEIAHEHVALARQLSQAVKMRISAGLGSPLEEGNAAVQLSKEEIALGAAETDLRRTWAALAATWGAPPDGAGRAAGDIHALAPLPLFADYAARLEANPHVARFAAARAAADARAQLARAGRTPDVSVSAGVRHLEGPGTQALVLGVSVPLGTAGRNAAAEREADAAASQARYAEAAGKLDHMATLYGLYEDARQARESYFALRGTSHPAAETTLTRAQEGFRAGRFSLLEISAAQEQLHGVESEMVDAASTYHLSIAELERLTHDAVPVAQREDAGATP